MTSHQSPPRFLARLAAAAPLPLAALAGVGVAALFRPGFVDGDGLAFLEHAATGAYTDWYPPFLASALALAVRLGGDPASGLALVTLVQAVIGAVGVYRLATEVLTLLGRAERPGAGEKWGALAVLGLLLTPFTPLMYYLAHYRNDSVEAVALTWAVAGWLQVERQWNRAPKRAGSGAKMAAWATAVGASCVALMARYNAVVLLPVFLLVAGLTLGRAGRLAAVAAACALVAGPPAAHRAVVAALGVARLHPERQIMALDLVGMVREKEALRAELPYTASHLSADAARLSAFYVPGFVAPVMPYTDDAYRVVSREYLFADYPALSQEYRRAVRRHPSVWLTVKAKAAAVYLLDPAPHWHHRVIDPNRHGIEFHRGLRSIRSLLLDADAAIAADPILRFVCARHLVLTGLPLVYAASTLLAVAAHDYRYMFPSTLLIQIGSACLAGRALASRAGALAEGLGSDAPPEARGDCDPPAF